VWDWLLVLGPIAGVVYFLVYPDQFGLFVAWASRLIG